MVSNSLSLPMQSELIEHSVCSSLGLANPPLPLNSSAPKIRLMVKLVRAVQMIRRQPRSFLLLAAFDGLENLSMLGERQLFEPRHAHQIEVKLREPREESLA